MSNSINLTSVLPTLLNTECAKELGKAITDLDIIIPKNRFIVASPDSDLKVGSLYLPSENESMPKVGTIIYACGKSFGDDTYCDYDIDSTEHDGKIVTYGIYGGKECYITIYDTILNILNKYGYTKEQFQFKVLSSSEISMIQPFPKK